MRSWLKNSPIPLVGDDTCSPPVDQPLAGMEVSIPAFTDMRRAREAFWKYPSVRSVRPEGVGVGLTETTDRMGKTRSAAPGLSSPSEGAEMGRESSLKLTLEREAGCFPDRFCGFLLLRAGEDDCCCDADAAVAAASTSLLVCRSRSGLEGIAADVRCGREQARCYVRRTPVKPRSRTRIICATVSSPIKACKEAETRTAP